MDFFLPFSLSQFLEEMYDQMAALILQGNSYGYKIIICISLNPRQHTVISRFALYPTAFLELHSEILFRYFTSTCLVTGFVRAKPVQVNLNTCSEVM